MRRDAEPLSDAGLNLLHHYRGTVAENFRSGAFADHFRRVITATHNRVGAQLLGMLNQEVVCLLPRLLAHFGVCPNPSANNVVEPSDDALKYRWRTHNDPADQAFVLANFVAFNSEGRSNRHPHSEPPVI